MSPTTRIGLPEHPVPELNDLLRAPADEQFPGLRGAGHRFDAPGGTLVHAAVVRAMSRYLGSRHVANDHGPFPASAYSDVIVEWAADRVRALLGAAGGHILFGPNMTTLTTMFSRGVAGDLRPGDEIVCTELDHEANHWPWRAVAERTGARVRLARLHPDGALPAEAIIRELTPRTRWVAISGASNALATVPDVAAVSAAAHRVGARVYVDGVQRVAHSRVAVDEWGVDAFVTSAYKWYGPHCAALWLSDHLDPLLPEQVPSAGDALPGRLDLGTTQFEAVLGTGIAAEVLLGWDRTVIAEREHALAERIRTWLRADSRFRVLGPAGGTLMPIITFQVAGMAATAVATSLAARDVAVWDGTFYCGPAFQALSPATSGAVRAGVAAYTTDNDVTAFLDALVEVTRKKRAG
ncbi:aminotransferase class V-fold PLP-dependent enzyme [Micromonospora sp. BL1]|uniref:aminotransferase class V-fold PLP-dependent enzyme n=1 Tax=unclassified Micromonospora TaxID=2617518 RepID=UPI0013158901|nr:aminotransferase class V-fold PLP-dependent enzyme [Micromonospora sp. BL1]NED50670.1 aminotransferase class V-fold PLP-dependent enzyme [Micromonospora aurantiaca]